MPAINRAVASALVAAAMIAVGTGAAAEEGTRHTVRPGDTLGSIAARNHTTVRALAELREAGLIRELGLSNVTAGQLTEALDIAPVVCVQNLYGLTDRQDDDLMALCGERGVAFVPFFAVATASGATPGAPDETGQAEIAAVAQAHGATPAQVRLAWTLHQGDHVLAIPGTGDPAHLEQNIAAGALRLSREELDLLDGIRR